MLKPNWLDEAHYNWVARLKVADLNGFISYRYWERGRPAQQSSACQASEQ
jgi:hypothetical protein